MKDQPAQTRDLSALLSPQSVAVVGASRDEKKIGSIVVRNILDSAFPGQLYPINPKAQEVQGVKCYPDYKNLPVTPDLAILALPVEVTLTVLPEIVEKGTKNILIFSAGFKEIGAEGAEREKQLRQLALQHDLNILGPNCLGFVNNLHPINATFGQVVNIPGNLRFISQSGAIASSVFDWASFNQLGFRDFVTLGNKTVIDENEVLSYWLEHADTDLEKVNTEGLSTYQPIGLYLESISDGERFVEIAKKISVNHPLFALKPGKSKAAQSAMQSHTGAIAGEDAVLDTAFQKAGVIRCEGIEDLFDLARAFAWENAPEGPNIGIISNAGGPAVISTDIVDAEGMSMAPINEKTHALLEEQLPRAASLLNPIDVLGDALADRYAAAGEAILAEEEVHALLVILTPQVMTQIEATAEAIGQLSAKYGKPIVCSFMGGSLIAKGEQVLNRYKLPSFRFPERAIKAMARMWQWQQWRRAQSDQAEAVITSEHQEPHQLLVHAREQHQPALDAFESLQLLQDQGMSIPAMALVTDFEQEKAFAQEQGWPVVMKLSSPKLLHKKDGGGVLTNIKSETELTETISKLQQAKEKLDPDAQATAKVLIQKQVEKGIEVIVGVKTDPNFGQVLMFGAGGTVAELVADRNLALLPISREQIKQLVMGAKVFPLLSGYRGEAGYAIEQLIDLIEKLVHLAQSQSEIAEVEINPVFVTHDTAWAVDGKVLLKPAEEHESA